MTVGEFTYMVLDQCKLGGSDDSYLNESHIIFLLKKYRAFLIKKEQEKDKNAGSVASDFELQEICLDLEKIAAIDGHPCTGGYYLRSTKPIPKILDSTMPRIYPMDYYQGTHITLVTKDRMRYIGSNPYLKNIIYGSIEPNLHLYLYSSNPQFLYLKKLRMSAVFEDFEEANELACDDNNVPCDVLDMEVPLRDRLVPLLLELVVKEINNSSLHRPDEENNAKDDIPDLNRRA